MNNNTLVCDKCASENWNLASEGLSHDRPVDEIKGYPACDGVWRSRADRAADRQQTAKILPFEMPYAGASAKHRP